MKLAHPGKTNKDGCHTCYTNCAKWGLEQEEYHCHSIPLKKDISNMAGIIVSLWIGIVVIVGLVYLFKHFILKKRIKK